MKYEAYNFGSIGKGKDRIDYFFTKNAERKKTKKATRLIICREFIEIKITRKVLFYCDFKPFIGFELFIDDGLPSWHSFIKFSELLRYLKRNLKQRSEVENVKENGRSA